MADDIAYAIPEQQLRFNMNPTGVSECLVEPNKTVVPWGLGHVDDPDAISTLLVREIQQKCMPLEVFLLPEGGASSGKTGHAQGGFIRVDPIQARPGGKSIMNYSVLPITAKHNLRRVTNLQQEVYVPFMAHFKVPHGLSLVNSPDTGWVPGEDDAYDLRAGLAARPAVFEYGIDVTLGQLVTNPSEFVTGENKSFARVRPDSASQRGFQVMRGQKVGIAVWFPEEAKPNKITVAGAMENEVDISDTKLKAIYGEPGQVNIYTGEIKYVGKDFIEYDINSFTGCSGAVVFLLDQGQPDSVDPSDYGKAVAIHSGAHPTLSERNVGFLINSHPSLKDIDSVLA